MAFRFRRSVRLLPGVRLNFSTGGISTSVGGRGAILNFSKRGTRATVGIPGTGISYSERIPAADRATGRSAAVKSGPGCALLIFGCIVLGALFGGLGKQSPTTMASPQAPLPVQSTTLPLEPGSKAHPSNKYSEQVFDMNANGRLSIMQRLLVTSGEQCATATEAVLKGSLKRSDYWRVSCSDSGDWMIQVEPSSATRILSCREMDRMGMPLDCRIPWTTAQLVHHRRARHHSLQHAASRGHNG